MFHLSLVQGLARWVETVARNYALNTVFLGGGCFLNRTLAEELPKLLEKSGICARLPHILPPTDGGLSFGQAAWGQALLRAGKVSLPLVT